MAPEKEEVIIDLKIDAAGAEKDLQRIERAILNNKEAQQDLNKAYKSGVITQDEYIKENIRLQANQKKEQDQKRLLIRTLETESNSRNALKLRITQLAKEYDGLNRKTSEGAKRANELEKELKQLNDQVNKTSKSAGLFKDQIGNYPDQFRQAAQSINVAGVSVSDIGSKLTAFANPAVAAVGIVGALGAAYARSTIGAKDLSFAQNQLSEATTIVTNKLAGLISSAEDGDGAVTKLLNLAAVALSQTSFGSALGAIGLDPVAIAAESKELALVTEQLEDLGRLESEIRTNASQRIEQNQELLEKIADDQQTINDRAAAANTIEQNLLVNKKNILDVLKSELAILQKQSDADPNNEAKQDILLAKRRAIAQESASLEKQLTKINKVQDDLNVKLNQEIELRRNIAREKNAPKTNLVEKASGGALADPAIEASKARQDQFIAELDTVEFTEDQKRKFYKTSKDIKVQLDQQQLDATASILGQAAGLFNQQTDAFKIIASAQTIITTYSSAQKAFDALADIPYVGPGLGAAAAAAAVADGLARVAIINGVTFASGGYTGPGFGPADSSGFKRAGIVHEHEYVAPKRVVMSPAAQPHIQALEGMRLRGYANGGLVTNSIVSGADQAMLVANAFRDAPAPEVSVVEINKVQRAVAVKQKISKLS